MIIKKIGKIYSTKQGTKRCLAGKICHTHNTHAELPFHKTLLIPFDFGAKILTNLNHADFHHIALCSQLFAF